MNEWTSEPYSGKLIQSEKKLEQTKELKGATLRQKQRQICLITSINQRVMLLSGRQTFSLVNFK